MNQEFKAVIGLEVHVQLSTNSKIFCGCQARLPEGKSVADLRMNANTCEVCTGQPGALPVINEKVVEYAIRAGLATNCRINTKSVFARKNYFYPDLPKGYQISQYEQPLCEDGFLDISMKGQVTKRVGIIRIHIEEDAGKNIHVSDYSLINLNRAGVPLVEIVSAPDMNSPEEAGNYLRTLYGIVTYLGICDGNLQEGNFRCDANVSVMPVDSKVYGTRTEIKNVNSFRFVEKALEYEIKRQIEVIKNGGRIVQETRTFDANKNVTISMRSKEEAHDYRYFPDPDLIPVVFTDDKVKEIVSALPELPEQKKKRYVTEFALSDYDAQVLLSSKSLALFFEDVLKEGEQKGKIAKQIAKPAANLLTGEVLRLLNEEGKEVTDSRIKPSHIVDLVEAVNKNILSSSASKQVIVSIWKTGGNVSNIIEDQGLMQLSNVAAIEKAIEKVIAEFPGQVAEYRAGKEKILGFLVGQVMKQTGGKANPGIVQDLMKKQLSS